MFITGFTGEPAIAELIMDLTKSHLSRWVTPLEVMISPDIILLVNNSTSRAYG
jgi:hypothetical protein